MKTVSTVVIHFLTCSAWIENIATTNAGKPHTENESPEALHLPANVTEV